MATIASSVEPAIGQGTTGLVTSTLTITRRAALRYVRTPS
jgi:hypothetical protein